MQHIISSTTTMSRGGDLNTFPYGYRILQDGQEASLAPTSAPTLSPVVPESHGGGVGAGRLLFGVFLCLVGGFCGWRLCVRFRHRREQRLLDMRSAQANRVLGDMQMIPNEDLDDGLI